MDSELLDVFDDKNFFVGRADRSVVHRFGLLHMVFHGWLVSNKNQAHLIFQRRSLTRELSPGIWDIAAAGHYQAGESGLDGLREVREELGFEPRPENVEFLTEYRLEYREQEIFNRERCMTYLIHEPRPLREYSPSPLEVTDLCEVPVDRAAELFLGHLDDIVCRSVSFADEIPKDNETRLNRDSFGYNKIDYYTDLLTVIRHKLETSDVR